MQMPGYRIEQELGQGGMAVVHLALQESLHRYVALKIIKPVLTTDEEFAQRFLREGRIIAQLSDPHIVTVYDIGSHEGLYYLSMEYLSGGTLQQRIRDGLSLADALFVARAVVAALDYAHRRNIIHRDIKPQNILFRENGTPVLTDFGIAKTLGSSTIMTRTGVSVGTPRYMSPEQIRGQSVDARADLYSFGVLLYEMLTGNVPYNAEDSFALAMMHVTAPIPELPENLSRFQPLLNKLMEKDPDQRLQSGEEVILALNIIETGASDRSLARPVRPSAASEHTQVQMGRRTGISSAKNPTIAPAPAQRPARRLGWRTGMLAGILTVAAASGGYWYVSQPTSSLLLSKPDDPQPNDRVRESQEQLHQAQMQADQFFEKARGARQEEALENSLNYIEKGLQAIPNHSGLLNLRRELLRAQAEQRQKTEVERQKQVKAKAETERQKQIETERQRQVDAETERQEKQAEAEHQKQIEAERQRQVDAAKQEREAEQRQRQARADEFWARARDHQRSQAYESSLLQIKKGLQQMPDDSRLLALRREVRQQLQKPKVTSQEPVVVNETAKITALLRKCDAHLRANRLTVGRGGNAADCYGEVLRLDRGNVEALAGLDKIADRYAGLVTTALRRNKIKQARSYLARMESVNPNHYRLSELRQQITQAETPPEPPPRKPEPKPEPQVVHVPVPAPIKPEPVKPPPIRLVSTPEPKTQTVKQDRQTRITKTETEDSVSVQVTTTRQGTLDNTSREKTERADTPPQLFIRANVNNAEVWINKKMVGTTPLAVDMPTGSFRVSVRREGYADWNGKVRLRAGDESRINATLSRKLKVAAVEPPPAPEPEPRKPVIPDPPPEPKVTKAPEPKLTRDSRQAPNCLRGNCDSGQGVYRYPDGSTYSGQFRNAKIHGQGTYAYARRGEKYTGQWRNGVISGRGTYFYRSGNRYEGQWRRGRKNGQGTYYYAGRNEKYVGNFANDQPNGYGVYYYNNGNRYEGEWRNGRKNGQGTLYEGGRKIVGEWRNDQKVRVTVVED